MAYLPADIVEVVIHGELASGRPAYNVFQGNPGAVTPAAWAQVVLESWQDQIMEEMTNDYTVVDASWRNFDDTTGTAVPDPAKNLSGVVIDAAAPPNVAVLVRKRIEGAVGVRGGRFYIPSIPAGDIGDTGVIDPADLVDWNNAVQNFFIDGEAAGDFVVVHRDTDTGEATGSTNVDSFTVDGRCATQRRRLRK